MHTLHVYAQPFEHTEAHICGEREALIDLRDALTRAIDGGRGQCDAFVNDGEGYTIYVTRATQVAMNVLRVPYLDQEGRCDQRTAGPWDLWS